ncbi:hypothetical protein M407DRAFT_26391 [Tulasnella calospora MUT 4182]|uniref:F-box domain-containing protein n=1 Tax=Tulasnella calospora MUT 4182 TaxID=1051891 RepID=A0A0C3QEC1_9AGAM|nr:hypothetical protein M407DRAFT_26391 [Tulasnella calospora MUT 4182]
MQVQTSRQDYRPTSYDTSSPFKIRYNSIAARSRGTIRLTESGQVGPNAGDVVSTDEVPQRKISFLDLPTDIFLRLLEWLEMPDILNLRRACKWLKTFARLHATWVFLATYHVIGKNLPWPAWALPLLEVPSATLEHLTLRALRMRRLWDCGSQKTERKLSRFIQRPRESITWICLIRSRWLLIQQNGATLELWDLEDVEYKRPNLIIDSFEGIVDGSVVRSNGEFAVTTMISTRYEDTSLAKTAVALLTSSFVASLDLARSDPQQAFAIQLKRHVVAVATAWSVDLYWRETILTALQSAGGGVAPIQPFQRLTYFPGYPRKTPIEAAIPSAHFLANNPGFASLPSGEDTILLCSQGNISGQILHVAQLTEITPRGPPTYRMLPPDVLFRSDPYTMLFYDLGQSGRRSVFVVDDRRGLSLCGVSVPLDLSGQARGPAKMDYIGRWCITDSSSKDLVYHVAFEEATGTCAVAMGSGRVWIEDLTASEIITQNTSRDLDISAETVTPRADIAWPGTHPLPWPAVIREPEHHLSLVEASSGDWSADVETYYPSKNRTDCFGGATWFVNQALNIPGPATSLFFNVPTTRWPISSDVEIIGTGDRLLAVQRSYDDDSYAVVLFDQGVRLDDVVKRLREGHTGFDLPGNEVPFDSRPLERYITWRRRIEPLSVPRLW